MSSLRNERGGTESPGEEDDDAHRAPMTVEAGRGLTV